MENLVYLKAKFHFYGILGCNNASKISLNHRSFLMKKEPLKPRSALKTQINAKERHLHKELGF